MVWATTMRETWRWVSLVCLLTMTVLPAEAQLWQATPYRVLILLELPDDRHADVAFQERFKHQLRQLRHATSGSIWQVTLKAAGVSLDPWFLNQEDTEGFLKHLQAEQISETEWDRIALLSVCYEGHWQVKFREFDTLTRIWGNCHTSTVLDTPLLARTTLRLVYEQTAPLARIERVQDSEVQLIARAATLIHEEKNARTRRLHGALSFAAPIAEPVWNEEPVLSDEPAWIGPLPGEVRQAETFQPVLRRNDRTGKLAPGGISAVPWTYIQITDSDWQQLSGQISSGFRQPLPGRRNVRTQRIALGLRPAASSTLLRVVDETDPSRPLAGYEIYAKPDDPESEPQLLGMTDPAGRLAITATTPGGLRLLYVRSGGNLLARLPLVPGHKADVTAGVANDQPRLMAEGFVEGWRDQLVDTMARRQLLAQRIERRIAAGDVAAAQRWLTELRASRTMGELAFELRSAKGEFITEPNLDPQIKRRIDQLFNAGQRLIAQDRSLLIEADLARRLEQTQQRAAPDPVQ